MKKILAQAITVTFLVSFFSSLAFGAVKSGATCNKEGSTSILSGKKFTCVKSGKKLVWDKGSIISTSSGTGSTKTQVVPPKTDTVSSRFDYTKTYSTDRGFAQPTEYGFALDQNGPCAMDPNVPAEWAQIENYSNSFFGCAGQVTIAKYFLGNNRPLTSYESQNNFANTTPCKLSTPQSSRSGLGYSYSDVGRQNWRAARWFLSSKTVIQLIPVFAEDSAKPINAPANDYKKYLDFYKDWIDYSSDFGTDTEIRIPDNYIKFPGKLSDYKVYHTNNWDNPEHVKFNKAITSAVDSEIDFTGVNIAIIITPPGTDAGVLGQATLGPLQTSEGQVAVSMSQYSALSSNPYNSKFTNLGAPFWWIHELFHAGFGFDDHYGDAQNNINAEYGMGWLTLMTPWGGDLTTWEKWILGFIRDSQIQCVSGSSSSTHWISPSTVKSTESKAIVIPLSITKAIVVETIRSAGLFYKIPKKSQGALVYEIDLMKDGHGMGMKLSLPNGRTVQNDPFFMADAPLKQGESTITNGYKVSVLESGTFGDVIKVEKI